MRVWEASCDDCSWRARHTDPRYARAAVSRHVCTCVACGHPFPALVEGTDMCIPCDLRFYPAEPLPVTALVRFAHKAA